MTTPLRTPRILFVNNEPEDDMTPFIQKDLLLLRRWYPVEYLSTAPYGNGHFNSLLSPKVWSAVLRNDIMFLWFGGNAPVLLIAAPFRKPSLIVGGGIDVVSVPEIGYGLTNKTNWLYFIKTLGFRLTNKVLLFSKSSLSDFVKLPGVDPRKGEVLYLSVDTDYFKPSGDKKNCALSFAYLTESNMVRKGIRTFIETARLTPEINFRLVGKIPDEEYGAAIRAMLPPNVDLIVNTDNDALLREHIPAEYQAAKVYVQLSYHEGFGVAMAEAMACGCIPVVTDRGAIPEVVGDTGIYVPTDDPAAASAAIRKIMSSADATQGQRARDRILHLYSTSRRAEGLKAAIEDLARK